MKLPRVLVALRNAFLTVLFLLFAGNAFAFDGVEVGSTITFGRYPQTESGEIKPIEWQVLEVKDNKAFLLANKQLDAAPYHAAFEDVTWKTSSIRQWLNTDFYNSAFNESEKSRIVITVLKNPGNPKADTVGGGDTEDRIFLLSLDEAERFIKGNREMMRKPSLYARKRGASAFWWLRSPGYRQYLAALVMGCVPASAGSDSLKTFGVVPALWMNL